MDEETYDTILDMIEKPSKFSKKDLVDALSVSMDTVYLLTNKIEELTSSFILMNADSDGIEH